jgi:hypothetical protein
LGAGSLEKPWSADGDFGGARFLREQADAARHDGHVQYGAAVVLPCGRAASRPDCLDLVDASQQEVLRSEDGRLYRLPLGTPVDD